MGQFVQLLLLGVLLGVGAHIDTNFSLSMDVGGGKLLLSIEKQFSWGGDKAKNVNIHRNFTVRTHCRNYCLIQSLLSFWLDH